MIYHADDLNRFAAELIAADLTARRAIFDRHAALIGLPLAYTLKDQCYAAWNDDPGQAVRAAETLALLAEIHPHPEIEALAVWTAGIAALATGQLEQALSDLDAAAARYDAFGQRQTAASVQIGKLMALAFLGRYEEAITCGIRVRDLLLAYGDTAAAGRVELNLGNIAWRRDNLIEAEHYYRSAHTRLAESGDPALLAGIESGLAQVFTRQRRFTAARALFKQALARAEAAQLEVVQAEAECNFGNLALAEGNYDEALAFLERSRRRYAALEMPHEMAYADLELAEAYLELNLAPEAAEIFARVIPLFAELGMVAEQAWALAHYGQTALLLGNHDAARRHFHAAQALFSSEGIPASSALVTLFEAQLHYREQLWPMAAQLAEHAARIFHTVGDRGHWLFARWFLGESLRAAGDLTAAQPLLEAALQTAEAEAAPQIVQRCATSLGLLLQSQGDIAAAETRLLYALEIIERMRAPLPAEEFRTAFLSDKLSPFAELTRICLDSQRPAEALSYVERARSRALVEMLGAAPQTLAVPGDAIEAALFDQLTVLRQELNWCYQRISRLQEHEGYDAHDVSELHAVAREHEAAILEIHRQIQQYGGQKIADAALDLPALQAALGADTVLVEYYSVAGDLLAFIVTADQVQVVRRLGPEHEVEELVDRLRFQIDAMRRTIGQNANHNAVLTARARHYLARLYDTLIRPLAGLLGERRLVVVPHRSLHYVPFRALFDGAHYLIEQREVCTAPSAAVLDYCLRRPSAVGQRAIFLGVPDTLAPKVRDEVLTIAPLWPDSLTLLDADANLAALRRHAPTARILHLACHGQFRADSPLFSALQLADGRLTVRDAYGLNLACDLVVLSACETGISAVAPGDELIGLARGFFAAGAPSLLVSLWTVDDTTTAELMTTFYQQLRKGDSPAAALRHAQCALLQTQPHPFFWASFVLMGRW